MMHKNKATQFVATAVLTMSLLSGCSNNTVITENQAPVTEKTATEDAVSTEIAGTDKDSAETEIETHSSSDSLVIAEQGIFSAGGITVTSDGTFDPENHWEETGAGQTSHVDHANVLYQIPENETGLPMVFLHGYGQSRMGWMTTPDGREGWANMFLRMGHSVFLIDEPRRGEAGATSVSGDISTKTLDQRWYTQFRIGRWEDGKSLVNEGSQFPNDDVSVDQFFRQMTPDTGMTSDMGADFDNETVARALAATIDEVYERTGKNSILVTHSQGGGPGWTAAQYTDHIAAIVAIEPGGAPFAESDEYKAVTEKNIPVTMYFGDYIDNGDVSIQATGMWQMMRQTCYDFEMAYTAQGGNCTVVDLPKEGITGNDHFMFQDLNNDVIAEHIENWIQNNVEQ
ncbi:MAG: alpha/beta fold hydrolase [Lachnospiraceae bacterium]